MKNLYRFVTYRLQILVSLVGFVAPQTTWGQSIPDVQWSRSGNQSAVTTDGNLVVADGTQLVKYDGQGNPLWTVSTVAPPFIAPRTVRIAATSTGGVVAILTGTIFGPGQGPTATVFRLYDGAGAAGSSTAETDAATTGYGGLLGTPDGGFLVLSSPSGPSTVVRKYNGNAQLTWTTSVAYPDANAGPTAQTRGSAAANAPDGGYVLGGAYLPNATTSTGWAAKLDAQGTVSWQKLLADFLIPSINDNEVVKAVRSMIVVTDVIRSVDGTGYALTGSGRGFVARGIAPPQTVLIELTATGDLKRSRLTDAAPSSAYLTRYTGKDGSQYYAIGNTSTEDYVAPGTTYQVLSLRADLPGNQPSSLPVVAQRTFPPFSAPLNRIATMGDGGLVLTGAGGVVKLVSEQLPLQIDRPTYNCQTGELVVNVSGGTRSPIDYQVLGLRSWGAGNVFLVPTHQQQGTIFNLDVRQNGRVISLPFTTGCVVVPNGQFVLRPPDYNCQTGEFTIVYSNGDGTAVDYRVAGLRDWGPSPTFTIPVYQRNGTTFTLQARTAGGRTAELAFTPVCPPAPLPGNPAFGLTNLNCTSGQFQLTTVGGDNTLFEFKVPGLRDWGPSALFTVPVYQRNGTTFTLYLRQSGREYSSLFTTTCPVGTRIGAPEPAAQLRAVVYPNPVGEQFTVDVQGAARQSVEFLITDVYGRQVQRRQVTVTDERHHEQFTLPATTGGLYLLRVATPEQRVTVKVLKQY